ncbi:MAG: DUF2007 domain-containing protein [Bacteroidia bacterium]|nr:DUF2007 domain-containing protein [Bacteroidia bacterium]
MENRNNIVVLRRYEQLIEANIAKTKLDAFGVPCFLTEEHVTHLMNPLLSGGIRLHIFEQDREDALQLVGEAQLFAHEEDGLLTCSKCGSRKILGHVGDSLHNMIGQAW